MLELKENEDDEFKLIEKLSTSKGTKSKKEGDIIIQLFAKPTTVRRLLFGKISRISPKYNLIFKGFERGQF